MCFVLSKPLAEQRSHNDRNHTDTLGLKHLAVTGQPQLKLQHETLPTGENTYRASCCDVKVLKAHLGNAGVLSVARYITTKDV